MIEIVWAPRDGNRGVCVDAGRKELNVSEPLGYLPFTDEKKIRCRKAEDEKKVGVVFFCAR